MDIPPNRIMFDLSKLVSLFAELKKCGRDFVSPQMALPDLELTHHCSQISLLINRLRGAPRRLIEESLEQLKVDYIQLGLDELSVSVVKVRNAIAENEVAVSLSKAA